MPIASTDIVFRLSVDAAAGDTDPQPDPNASLGDVVATTAVDLVSTDNNLFDDVTGGESDAGDTEYRLVFILNNHATLTLKSAVVWIQSEVANGADAAIGLDPAGKSAKGAAAPQAEQVANENTAPTGVTFSSPTTKGTGLSLGDLAPGEVYPVWVRRTVAAATSAQAADGVTLRVEGDTDA